MFSAFERLVAFRYLRARRQEGLVSVIAAFSLIGIFLGVATLIIVMSVMNGFREELLTRILGLNGHMTTYAHEDGFTDFDTLVGRSRGGWHRHRLAHRHRAGDRGGERQGHLRPGARRARGPPGGAAVADGERGRWHARRFRRRRRRRDRQPHGAQARRPRRRFDHAALAGRPDDPDGVGAALARLRGGGHLRYRHVRVRRHVRLHAARSSPRSISGRRARSPPSR